MAEANLTMDALAARTGVPARTLRHWILKGVLPKTIGVGRGSRYDERHELRAKAAHALLRTRRLSVTQLRAALDGKTDEQLRALLPSEPRATTPDGVPVPPAAPRYPFGNWQLVPLTQGLYLMVSADGGELPRRIADAIYQHYGAGVAGTVG